MDTQAVMFNEKMLGSLGHENLDQLLDAGEVRKCEHCDYVFFDLFHTCPDCEE